MKLLSIAVPCFNSQNYMRHCVDTLLTGGDEVEILIVNDGSKDDTAAIADEYERLYPGIVRAVHQENGGHGAAVMAGLKNAQGRYFKVVDSDDWVDEEAFAKILCALRGFVHGGQEVDLVVSNFVYDKVGARHKKVMSYGNALPEEQREDRVHLASEDEESRVPDRLVEPGRFGEGIEIQVLDEMKQDYAGYRNAPKDVRYINAGVRER